MICLFFLRQQETTSTETGTIKIQTGHVFNIVHNFIGAAPNRDKSVCGFLVSITADKAESVLQSEAAQSELTILDLEVCM